MDIFNIDIRVPNYNENNVRHLMKKILQAVLFGLTLPVVTLLNHTGIGRSSPEIITIDPENITKVRRLESDPVNKWTVGKKWTLLPRTRAGNWDRKTIHWETYATEIQESVQMRYEYGYDWKKTPYYEMLVDGLETGDTGYTVRFENTQHIQQHLSELDDLYETIDAGGYKRTIDVFDDTHSPEPLNVSYHLKRTRAKYNDVAINFDRNGEAIFIGDGTHRVALSKVAEIETIPVRVHVRHEEWVKRKKMIMQHCRENGNLTPISHPDIPFDDHEIPVDEIVDELKSDIDGELCIEITGYVFPNFATEYDHIETITFPTNWTIRRLNEVFEYNSKYDFTQVDSVDDIPDRQETVITTTSNGCIESIERQILSQINPDQILVVGPRNQEPAGVPAAYSRTDRSVSGTLEWHVYDK